MSTGDSIPLSGRSCHNLDRVREREKEKKCLVVELCLIKLIIYYFKVACYCTLLSQAEKNKRTNSYISMYSPCIQRKRCTKLFLLDGVQLISAVLARKSSICCSEHQK